MWRYEIGNYNGKINGIKLKKFYGVTKPERREVDVLQVTVWIPVHVRHKGPTPSLHTPSHNSNNRHPLIIFYFRLSSGKL